MTKIERRLFDFVSKHLTVIAFIIITVLGVVIRIIPRDFVSGDARGFLLPWYEKILENGVSCQVGDYNFTYQLAILLLTKLPLKPLYAYKLLSCIFDFLLAGISSLLVYDFSRKTHLSLYAYCAVLLSPLVVMNSSVWAQCDSIYVFFAMVAAYMMMKDRPLWAMVFFGLSLAFKLQVVFLFPALCILYVVKRNFSALHFLCIPAAMVAISLPMLLVGRNLSELYGNYLAQAGRYPRMYMNYPSFYCVFRVNDYNMFSTVAILFTIVALGLLAFWIVYNKIAFTRKSTVILFFLSAFTCVLFFPAMHERYGYSYEILACILAFMLPGTTPLCIGLQLLSIRTYSAYLFGASINLDILAFVNLFIYFAYLYILLKEMRLESDKAKKQTNH